MEKINKFYENKYFYNTFIHTHIFYLSVSIKKKLKCLKHGKYVYVSAYILKARRKFILVSKY